jgi:hypothetical protein
VQTNRSAFHPVSIRTQPRAGAAVLPATPEGVRKDYRGTPSVAVTEALRSPGERLRTGNSPATPPNCVASSRGAW